ncbi:hypothetical protein JHD50_02320 [Sulfurimonas sp. MAG313]|nr:hypothetical protein [Sulfurimonas sp. MAG313]MDF1880147.1 hypothetical protein [Sulfurimonas sp. MAG313]
MNTLTPQSLKQLLYALALSLLIIMVFLIFKFFFQEQKILQTHSFSTASKTQKKETMNKEKVQKKFLLLPSKEDLK